MIQDLELDIYHIAEETKQEQGDTVKQLEKKNALLMIKLQDYENRVNKVIKSKEEEEDYFKNDVKVLQSHIDSLEKEKRQALESASKLKVENSSIYEQLNTKEKEFRDMKEDMQNQLTERVRKLKSEKLSLEVQLEEIFKQSDVSRSSLIKDGDSLQDELSQIEDYRSSKASVARSYLMDSKKLEAATQEIQHLTASKQTLEKQLVSLNSLNKQLTSELEICRAELRGLQTNLILSKESWSSENNSLQSQVNELEVLVTQTKLQYAEVATENDILEKRYKDLAKSKEKGRFGGLFKKKTINSG